VRFMVVEHFKDGNAAPVYERFREHGRLAPEGLTYLDSWVDAKLERCFQLMEAAEISQLEEWMSRWADLVDFEVFPVISSAEANERVPRSGS